ncbi:MAG: hypothetical protein DLM58_21690 [Pseudonocardiales bacterium]|nr:MAG: hypothetical protein DLM58_21690 [Pseudonocardiales bacterium]
MSTTATIESPQVRLDAGGEAVVPLHIRNNGTIVEGYRLEVVGVPADWTTVEPDVLSLYPGDSTTATIAFRPPRTPGVPAGELSFGVRVVPTEHPNEAIVPEGVVEVLPFLETTAELIPRTSHGGRNGRHQLAVDNRGNVAVSVQFSGVDPGQLLDVDIRPNGLTVNAGNAAFADVRLKPQKLNWRKPPTTHPFSVTVTPHAGQPVTLDGAYLQEPLLPRWLGKALLALVALVALFALLWFAVLKPTIKSAAREAVADPLASASKQAAAAEKKADASAKQAGAANKQAAEANKRASDAVKAVEKVGVPVPVPAPFSTRLAVLAGKGQTNSKPFVVPAGKTFNLTDLVLENPQGDFGKLTLAQGNKILLVLALENFRDLDYHFVSPIVAGPGTNLTLTVQCNSVGKPPDQTPPPTQCDTAVLLGGSTTR